MNPNQLINAINSCKTNKELTDLSKSVGGFPSWAISIAQEKSKEWS